MTSADAWWPSTTFANAVACAVVEERAAIPDWPAEPTVADGTAVDVTACAVDGDGPTTGEPLPKLNGLAVDPTVNRDRHGALPLLLPTTPLAVELSSTLGLVAARVGLAPLLLPMMPLAVELSLTLGLVAARVGLAPLLLPVTPLAVELSLTLGLVAARVGLAPLLLPVTPLAVELSLTLGLVAARVGLAPLLLPITPPAAELLPLWLVARDNDADGGTAPCRFARCAFSVALLRVRELFCRPVRPP